VAVTAPNTQTVGQPLTLICNVTTVRGITSTVDIVWRSGGSILNRLNNVTQTLVDSSLLYMGTYIITSLSTDNDRRDYECSAIIRTSPVIRSSGYITMDVAGTYTLLWVMWPIKLACTTL